MDAGELVLEYVRVLAWPLVTIVAVTLFRSEFRAALQRLTGGELDAMGLKVRLELDRARKEVESAETAPHTEPPVITPPSGETARKIEAEAKAILREAGFGLQHPNFTPISSAWIALLMSVVKVCEKVELEPTRESPGGLFHSNMLELHRRGIISINEVAAAQRLANIYNTELNSKLKDTPYADLYLDTAKELARVIVTKTLEWHYGQEGR